MPSTKPVSYHLLVDEGKRAARRREAVLEVRAGAPKARVALRHGVSRETLYTWLARADADTGEVPLKDSGVPCRLSAEHKERLGELLDKGPRACGLDADAWTLKRVRDVIEREFSVKYAWGHVGIILHSIGFSPQKPERVARERKPEKIEEWKRTVLPALEKKSG